MTRSRPVLLALSLAALAACADGMPTVGRTAVTVDVVPRFQIDPDLFDYDPIDRIRLTARAAESGVVVGQTAVTVSPTAASWSVSLSLDIEQQWLAVLVEVELLSGGVVQWSGIQGPFTVRRGVTTTPQTVPIHRGPLDNRHVTAVVIEEAEGTLEMVAGTSTTLAARVTLAPGADVSPVVYWTSSNEAVATVTAEGMTSTLTAVAPGTANIVASSGSAYDEVALEVLAPSPFDVTWLGVTSDWHTGSNWSTGLVPQPTESVEVPATANDPLVTQDTEVGTLVVEAGAAVEVSDATLIVNGNLDAGQTITGSGFVEMAGPAATLRGAIEAGLTVTGNVLASGPVSAAGIGVFGTGASFDVNGQQVQAESLTTSSQGVLRMTSAGGVLDVSGNVLIDGGSSTGQLTAGTLRVGGDFSVGTASATSFAPSGSHLVVFDGAQDQTIQLGTPGTAEHRFANLRIDQPNVVMTFSDLVVTGVLTVADGSLEASDFSVYVGGGLDDPEGGLTHAGLHLIGNIASIPAAVRGPVYVEAAVVWPADATIEGALFVDQSLSVGTTTLTVTADMISSGTLNVPVGGALDVSGVLTLGEGSVFLVNGTVTAVACANNGAAVSGTGTHPCGGGSPAPTGYTWDASTLSSDWDNPTNWIPAGVPGPQDDITVASVTVFPTLSADRAVANVTLTGSGAVNLAGFSLTVSGNVDATLSNGFLEGELIVNGPGSLLQGFLGSLRLEADRVLTGQTFAQGDVTLLATLDVGEFPLTTAGSLRTEGATGRLVMANPDATVVVMGDAYFNGGDHDGALTDGLLQVWGNFEATDASATSFVSSGDHRVAFTSTAADRTVRFQMPGPTRQRLNHVAISGSDRTDFETNAFIAGDLDVFFGMMSVPAGATVSVEGAMSLGFGVTLWVDGTVEVAGQCLASGPTAFFGSGSQPCGEVIADRLWLGGEASSPRDWATGGNWTPPGVPGPGETALIPYRPVNYPLLTGLLTVDGLIVTPGGIIDLDGFMLTVTGEIASDGSIVNGPTLVTSASQGASGLRGQFEDLRLAGQAARALSGNLVVFGDLTVEVPLVVNEYMTTVTGSLSTATPLGGLVMNSASSGTVIVEGDATFDGGASTGLLSDGLIAVGGDFNVGNTNVNDAFFSTGTRVFLQGGGDQTLRFTQPSPETQAFSDLTIVNAGTTIFESDVWVSGTFQAVDAELRATGGQWLFVVGTDAVLRLSRVEILGLPVILETFTQSVGAHVLDDVSFSDMDDDETQLYLQLPGDAGGAALQINRPVFGTPLAEGLFLQAENAPAVNFRLLVQVNEPTPATAVEDEQYRAGANAQIIWGSP